MRHEIFMLCNFAWAQFWIFYGWVAQFGQDMDGFACLVIISLGLRAVVFDRRDYRRRIEDAEIPVSLNCLEEAPGGMKLTIRTIDDPSIAKLVNGNSTAARLLAKKIRAQSSHRAILCMAKDDRQIFRRLIRQELSPMSGPAFLANELAREDSVTEHPPHHEVSVVYAFTAETRNAKKPKDKRIGVQLIRRSVLEKLIKDPNVSIATEYDDPKYHTRVAVLHELAIAWSERDTAQYPSSPQSGWWPAWFRSSEVEPEMYVVGEMLLCI